MLPPAFRVCVRNVGNTGYSISVEISANRLDNARRKVRAVRPAKYSRTDKPFIPASGLFAAILPRLRQHRYGGGGSRCEEKHWDVGLPQWRFPATGRRPSQRQMPNAKATSSSASWGPRWEIASPRLPECRAIQ